MTILAHISDLHFGREDPVVAEALVAELNELQPSLLIVSGDLTQRARTAQFSAAADYLRRLPFPQLVVPGNHDISLHNLFRRFFRPLRTYRRLITPDTAPYYQDDRLAVLGINTARSFTWKSGRISQDVLRTLEARFAGLEDHLFRVVVTHHPFLPPPGEESAGIDLVGRAEEALEALADARIDLLLAGHLHHGYTGDVRRFYPRARRSILVAQAGTAISHRVRKEPNAYNRIHISAPRVDLQIRRWNGDAFVPDETLIYRKEGETWTKEL